MLGESGIRGFEPHIPHHRNFFYSSMWIYCNLFVTKDVTKLQLFPDKSFNPEHALRRPQTFKTIPSAPEDPYWMLYDREIDARRKALQSMSLASFAMFFLHMESRWFALMRRAIEENGGNEETVEGFVHFCDAFESRYSECLARYTDLDHHEHDYAWVCILHANCFKPEALLTKDLTMLGL